jgi:hypothetical protein
MVERSLAWLTRDINRRLRHRGVERDRLWWSHRCAAINLQRLLKLGSSSATMAAGPSPACNRCRGPADESIPGMTPAPAPEIATRPRAIQ